MGKNYEGMVINESNWNPVGTPLSRGYYLVINCAGKNKVRLYQWQSSGFAFRLSLRGSVRFRDIVTGTIYTIRNRVLDKISSSNSLSNVASSTSGTTNPILNNIQSLSGSCSSCTSGCPTCASSVPVSSSSSFRPRFNPFGVAINEIENICNTPRFIAYYNCSLPIVVTTPLELDPPGNSSEVLVTWCALGNQNNLIFNSQCFWIEFIIPVVTDLGVITSFRINRDYNARATAIVGINFTYTAPAIILPYTVTLYAEIFYPVNGDFNNVIVVSSNSVSYTFPTLNTPGQIILPLQVGVDQTNDNIQEHQYHIRTRLVLTRPNNNADIIDPLNIPTFTIDNRWIEFYATAFETNI